MITRRGQREGQRQRGTRHARHQRRGNVEGQGIATGLLPDHIPAAGIQVERLTAQAVDQNLRLSFGQFTQLDGPDAQDVAQTASDDQPRVGEGLGYRPDIERHSS